jgi:glycosyltransferase involved in cell wall biosynthesis
MEYISACSNTSTVSVVIPCYNHGKYLIEAIDSVKQQTKKDIEIIVIDDCSNDQFTKEVISGLKNDKTIKILQNTENRGVAFTRNRAIERSLGPFIVPLDADDKIAPTFIEEALNILHKGKADVVYSKTDFFGTVSGEFYRPKFSVRELLNENLVVNTAIYRKSAWREAGGYSEYLVQGLEDWDFWLSLVERGNRFFRIEKRLFLYRRHSVSRNESSRASNHALRDILFSRHRYLYDTCNVKTPYPDAKFTRKRTIHKLCSVLNIYKSELITAKKITKEPVKLFYYNPKGTKNFGDLLNLEIIHRITGKDVISVCENTATNICIGSLLDSLLVRPGAPIHANGVLNVWGAGFIAGRGKHPIYGSVSLEEFRRTIRFHAVRGKKTLERLSAMGIETDGIALGDPGLLAQMFVADNIIKKKYSLGIIPHYVDKNDPLIKSINKRIRNSIVINVNEPPLKVINKIASCDVIISSAMHGLIVADSLGIPNSFAQISTKLTGGIYKFQDYYSVYGLIPEPMDRDVLIEFSSNTLKRISSEYRIKSEAVAKIIQDLLKSCPFLK